MATALMVWIDQDLCTGDGICEEICGDVFTARDDGLWVGSRLWNAASKSYVRIGDAVKAIQAAVQGDMTKLVALKLADNVEVVATYRGQNRVEVLVTAITTQRRHVLNLSGSFVSGTWVWH